MAADSARRLRTLAQQLLPAAGGHAPGDRSPKPAATSADSRRTVIYFHSLSSPWAYLGGPRFQELVKKHDLNVVLRPTAIAPENGGIPLLTRPDPRRSYHELELDRWRKRLVSDRPAPPPPTATASASHL